MLSRCEALERSKVIEKQDKVRFTNEDSGESTGEPASQVVEVNAEEIQI